jgi:hypothetical protein
MRLPWTTIERPMPPIVVADQVTRRKLVRQAMAGTTHQEAADLARLALGMLRDEDLREIVREMDRELWQRIEP